MKTSFTRAIRFLSLCSLALVLCSQTVFADYDALGKRSGFYDPTACSAPTSTELLGSDSIEIGYNFFRQKGLSPDRSSAIIGNFLLESHMVPTTFNPAGGGKGAYGIAQWRAERQDKLKAKANFDTLPVQLEYVWEELNSNRNGALLELKAAPTIEQQVTVFTEFYEGNSEHLDKRINNAKEVYATYGASDSNATPTTTPTSTPSSDCPGVVGNGQDTKYIDGFTVYSQYDPAWKDLPYGSSTIGVSGCGPSAMAMIITNLTGRPVTPAQTASYAASQNLYIPGSGSSWSIAPVLAKHWGLTPTPIGADLDKIVSTLQAGGLVITSGAGPKPFTSGGHFIVIRGVTASGMFKIGDSGHRDTSDKEWDPKLILANARSGSIYAITN